MSLFLSRTDRSLLSQWWWTIDRKMLFALLAIVGFGIVMVSAASPAVATRIGLNEYHFIIRHMIFLVPALVAMIGLSFLSKSLITYPALLIPFFCWYIILAFEVAVIAVSEPDKKPDKTIRNNNIIKSKYVIIILK